MVVQNLREDIDEITVVEFPIVLCIKTLIFCILNCIVGYVF